MNYFSEELVEYFEIDQYLRVLAERGCCEKHDNDDYCFLEAKRERILSSMRDELSEFIISKPVNPRMLWLIREALGERVFSQYVGGFRNILSLDKSDSMFERMIDAGYAKILREDGSGMMFLEITKEGAAVAGCSDAFDYWERSAKRLSER